MEHVSNPAFALGIDISADKLDLALLSDKGKLRTKRLPNNPTGFKALLDWLSRSTEAFSTVHACMEASGGFEEQVAFFLLEQGLA